jgi:hypothetical protein
VAQKSRSEKSLRSGVGLVGQDRCDAKRGAAYGFCFRHRWISTPVPGASCSHHHGRNDELVAARSTRRAPGRTGASRLELLPPPRSPIPLEAVLSSKAASFPFSRGQIQATIGVRCLCRAPRPAFTRADSTIPSLGGLGCSGTMFLFFELNQPRYDENSFCNFSARLRDASRGSRCFKQPRRQRQPCAGQGFSFWKYSAAANGQ